MKGIAADVETSANVAHRVHSSTIDGDAIVDGMLAVARREMLVLATALQSKDEDAVLIASARVRWALASAHQFAVLTLARHARIRARLCAVIDAAERWLPADLKISLTPTRVQQILAALSEPSLRLPVIDASDTLLVAFNLDDLPLAGIVLRAATVAHVSARRAQLDAANAAAARILRSSFEAASLRLGVFDNAALDDCDLTRANLQDTTWQNTIATRCIVTGAVLLDARFDGSRFVECDFRNADFQFWTPGVPPPIDAFRFVRCDLRETNWAGRPLSRASFVDCKLFGAHGAVEGLADAEIERPDLSSTGDGSQVGTKADVLSGWQPYPSWPAPHRCTR